jgi:hypoxanthine phosphoribosyltransferase
MEMGKMEFKLNKIDTDIRNKMQEKIKDDKVHSGKEINVKQDLKDRGKNYYKNIEKDNLKEKRYLVVDGVRDTRENLSVEVEKLESINQENSTGRILDTKK